MNEGRLPDAILIGPHKAGTTYLRACFSAHPQIVWSRQAYHFLDTRRIECGIEYPECPLEPPPGGVFIDMFESLAAGYYFDDREKVSLEDRLRPGECFGSSGMHVDPLEMAKRIYRLVPDARIIMVLREQIAWLRSIYQHYLMQLPPGRRSFTDFLDSLEGKSALSTGLYHQTINAYQQQFTPAHVHVMLLEQMVKQPEMAFAGLTDFLGVDRHIPELPESSKNKGIGNRAGNLLAWTSKFGISDQTVKRLVHALQPIAPLLKNLLPDTDPIKSETRALLCDFYAASNHQTSKCLGLSLSDYGYSC